MAPSAILKIRYQLRKDDCSYFFQIKKTLYSEKKTVSFDGTLTYIEKNVFSNNNLIIAFYYELPFH